ncbi:phosphoribosylformylglycinamidine synthase [Gottschalkiaceae bacterium SANA]|nr:phosphoribosylformylglycinamidine synthase [Gottschalkiaceae bacterium SANA]
MVQRIFVEKKEPFHEGAQRLQKRLEKDLGLAEFDRVRIYHRYDVEGVEEDVYERAITTVFAEPPVDRWYKETLPEEGDWNMVVSFLPGQFDQRADSCEEAIALITEGIRPIVRVATHYRFFGSFSKEEQKRIEEVLINPVDSGLVGMEKPESLTSHFPIPEMITSVDGFLEQTKEQMADYRKTEGLAMTLEDLLVVQAYFKEENRVPTITEIKVIDTYWSDHCRHTTFSTKLEEIQLEDGLGIAPIQEALETALAAKKSLGRGAKDLTLMELATLGMRFLHQEGKVPDLDLSEEINACSIKIPVIIDGKEEDWLLMFKNETHNHPTEIEPFGGAATCLGGAIRDPLSGRSYVYQAMRVTGAADPRETLADTLAGKLPQRKITREAARGYSSYGNQIGLATGQVAEIYHPGYKAKRMEVGAVVAAAPASHVRRERPEAGDRILLLGGRTGRDGIGGATGSSKAHTSESIEQCGAEVQKGNPPTERKLQRLFRKSEFSRLIRRCNDFGAGGVSVAVGELADSLRIDLDRVPKKYLGLDGTELAISESQERMAIVVEAKDVEAVIALADQENVEATEIALVTDTGRLEMVWRQKTILDLSRAFLDTNGAKQRAKILVKAPILMDSPLVHMVTKGKDLKEKWLRHMGTLEIGSQQGLVEMFDSTIGAGTLLLPFGGKKQKTPEQGMAAKIPVLKGEASTASLMSYGFDPRISSWSPFHGAVYAVMDSLAKIVGMGGDYKKSRLSFQEYFERLEKDPVRWGKPFQALLGAVHAQLAFETPAIGGKDSMSGSFDDLNVPPTLISFAVNHDSVDKVHSSEFKSCGHYVLYLPAILNENLMPNIPLMKARFDTIHHGFEKGRIVTARAIGFEGIAGALSKMCFGNEIGVKIMDGFTEEDFFLPQMGGFLLEMDTSADVSHYAQLFNGEVLGITVPEPWIVAKKMTLPLADLQMAWELPLKKVFPIHLEQGKAVENIRFEKRAKRKASISYAKPRVFIPVFPGTNCEEDMARAFQKEGALIDMVVMRNQTPQQIQETIEAFKRGIDAAQIIALPGGFSAGDEPEGSGKFIANTFRNPRLMESVQEFLDQRDGLMIGICNGFQALIKLGLLPTGRIQELSDQSPTLTFNSIGRHVSMVTRTRVASSHSPWLTGVEVGDLHAIPVSHGEGRFVASEQSLQHLKLNGQICFQYVDDSGQATEESPFNPNGSHWGIEGICSPDGRILGKMGHSERIGNGLYQNLEEKMDQKLFASGVKYFR